MLGDGRCTLHLLTATDDTGKACTDNTTQINTIVLVKSLVLDRYKGMLQVLGDLIDCHISTVGAGGCQRLDLISR